MIVYIHYGNICIMFPCKKYYFSFFVTKLASDVKKAVPSGVLFRRHFKKS